jgi:hypothetical protein
MSTPTDEVKLRNQIVKYSVGTLFKIYTHKVIDPVSSAVTHNNEPIIMAEMLKMAKSRNYISASSTDLSLVPPPLVHDLLVKSIDTLKKAGSIIIP